MSVTRNALQAVRRGDVGALRGVLRVAGVLVLEHIGALRVDGQLDSLVRSIARERNDEAAPESEDVVIPPDEDNQTLVARRRRAEYRARRAKLRVRRERARHLEAEAELRQSRAATATGRPEQAREQQVIEPSQTVDLALRQAHGR